MVEDFETQRGEAVADMTKTILGQLICQPEVGETSEARSWLRKLTACLGRIIKPYFKNLLDLDSFFNCKMKWNRISKYTGKCPICPCFRF